MKKGETKNTGKQNVDDDNNISSTYANNQITKRHTSNIQKQIKIHLLDE
jgi:hypothetical protein